MENETTIQRARNDAWESIFKTYNLQHYKFDSAPFEITTAHIKHATRRLPNTPEYDVTSLCKQTTRESRPTLFQDNGLFLLPVQHDKYVIVQGTGYVDIPPITTAAVAYTSKLKFELETTRFGDSEIQHLDFAYATSLVRNFLDDDSLMMTIRGHYYTPDFSFFVGSYRIDVGGVQTEIDAGYEGRNQVVLVETKAPAARNTIIRQLFYPFRQWSFYTRKQVSVVFFERSVGKYYLFWQFHFTDRTNYNSIELMRTGKFTIDRSS